MAVLNTDPYYFIDEKKHNYSAAIATALEVMAEARRYDEYIRVGYENKYYVEGMKHYRLSGQMINRGVMLNELAEYLSNGVTIRVDDFEWSI